MLGANSFIHILSVKGLQSNCQPGGQAKPYSNTCLYTYLQQQGQIGAKELLTHRIYILDIITE